MQKYAKIMDESTGACIVGLGSGEEVEAIYIEMGLVLMEVEQAEDGGWYAAGKVPAPDPEFTARKLYETIRIQAEMKSVQVSIPLDDDETALTLAPICAEWKPNMTYEAGEILNHEGQAYRVMQKVDISLEGQPPGAEGMLAVYRPLNTENSGTIDDPIPFVSGMDVYNGKYYSYNGKLYLAKADMLPCTWAPGTSGLWQWEEVVG